MVRIAQGIWFAGINGLNVTDCSTVHTTSAQTLPRKVIRGTVEIIMHFQSTASFTYHDNAPFVDCEMTRLVIEASMDLLSWTKHKHCHADALNEIVDNSAFPTFHLAVNPHRRMGQLVFVHRRCVASRLGRHIDDAAPSFRRVYPERCPWIDHVRRFLPERAFAIAG